LTDNGFKGLEEYIGRGIPKYLFKVYAPDTLLNLNPNLSKKDLEKAMEDHIISRSQLTAVYERS
jgi:phosphatidylethanolamine-binding protein (PEBP) family uncharacterized protein